jgi:hypothetical protein
MSEPGTTPVAMQERGVAKDQASGVAQAPQAPRPAAVTPTRMIIRTAQMSLVIADATDVIRKLGAFAQSKGGYVTDSRQWRVDNQIRANVTIRVPAASLDATIDEARRLSIRVESETVGGQDVTEEFTDLTARLTNLEAAERELRELLTTIRQRTQKAAEILEIYNELTRIRGEIEQAKGRMQYLSQMTAMSTLSIDLIPDALAKPVVEPGWQPLATVKAASRALVNSLKALAEVAIWVAIYVLPIALLILLPIVGLWKFLRRKKTSVA